MIQDPESLRRSGFVGSDTLTPQKARILLMLGLTRTADSQEIKRDVRYLLGADGPGHEVGEGRQGRVGNVVLDAFRVLLSSLAGNADGQ